MADELTSLKMILDQYNGQIAYVRDIGQKLLVLQFTFIGLYCAQERFRNVEADNPGKFLAAYVAVPLFVAVLFSASYLRALACHQALNDYLVHAAMLPRRDLVQLGILSSDPALPIFSWAAPFFIIHVVFVGLFVKAQLSRRRARQTESPTSG